MTPYKINDLDNFIMGWHFEDTEFCDDLIMYHKTNPAYQGVIGYSIVDLEFKDSMDVLLKQSPILQMYGERLQQCVDAYVEKYNYCNEGAPWRVVEDPVIQKYAPNGGFHKWHCERTGIGALVNSRHLVFMTYLNDVSDAGETEFYYQKLKVKPEKGLTLIWPADWTFTHRGIASPTEEKIIITGWFNYVPKT